MGQKPGGPLSGAAGEFMVFVCGQKKTLVVDAKGIG